MILTIPHLKGEMWGTLISDVGHPPMLAGTRISGAEKTLPEDARSATDAARPSPRGTACGWHGLRPQLGELLPSLLSAIFSASLTQPYTTP